MTGPNRARGAWSHSGRSGCCRFLEKVRPPDLSWVLWAKRPSQATFSSILGGHPAELSAQWNAPWKPTPSHWGWRGCSRGPPDGSLIDSQVCCFFMFFICAHVVLWFPFLCPVIVSFSFCITHFLWPAADICGKSYTARGPREIGRSRRAHT